MLDIYSDNKKKIKKIGGLEGVKIIYKSDGKMQIKFKKKMNSFVIDFLKINIMEYGEIFENVFIDKNQITVKCLTGENENCLIDLKVKDYFDILQQTQAYIISPWLPDQWYLNKEAQRIYDTDEEIE